MPNTPEVRAWLDRQEIAAVTLRYATAIDTQDRRLLESCFTEDVVANYHIPGKEDLRGRDELVAMLIDGTSFLDATQHYVSNHVVDVDGDTATSTSYVVAQHVKRGTEGGSTFMVGGIYRDQFVRRNGEWRIANRSAEGVWVKGNRAVVQP